MTTSVTELFYQMRAGVESATIELVRRLLPKLRDKFTRHARRLRAADDIAVNAFYEFCVAIDNSKFEDIAAVDKAPDVHLELVEQIDSFLSHLSTPEIRSIAKLKLQGYTNIEIAERLGVSRRTVQYMIGHLKSQLAN